MWFKMNDDKSVVGLNNMAKEIHVVVLYDQWQFQLLRRQFFLRYI